MRPLKKGERLPIHKYKQYWAMSGRYHEYKLYDDNENFIADLYVPRHEGMPRMIETKEHSEV